MGTDSSGLERVSPTLVVAAALCQGGQVLISQRQAGQPGALLLEYPGGKVEPGETPMEALRRELEEELGVVIRDADPISGNRPLPAIRQGRDATRR